MRAPLLVLLLALNGAGAFAAVNPSPVLGETQVKIPAEALRVFESARAAMPSAQVNGESRAVKAAVLLSSEEEKNGSSSPL